MTAHQEIKTVVRVGATIAVVLLQVPSLSLLAVWWHGPPIPDWLGLPLMVGWFSSPFYWLSLLIGIPLLLFSGRARRRLALWAALAIGVFAQSKYAAVIGHWWGSPAQADSSSA